MDSGVAGFVIGMFIATCIWLMVLSNVTDTSYKEGQIDALTGKIKYELKTNVDSTRVWVEKSK